MFKSIKNIIAVLGLVATVLSCNQNPSLQTYFVDNELNPGFISGDIPVDLLNLEALQMTKTQKEAYQSVDKLNVLGYQYSEGTKDTYTTELANVTSILKQPKYEELMRGSTSDGKFVVKYIGNSEVSIDELIIFGSASNRGFIVARVLGEDMNAGKLMSLQSLLKDADFDSTQFSNFTEFFK